MESNDKIVRFDMYCKDCEYEKVIETNDPCNACLTEPVRKDSHQPVNYKDKIES